MRGFNKKFKLFSIILLSTMLVFFGCAKNVYKNLKLELSQTHVTVTLSDNEADNVFSVVATVSGLPKRYDGEVSATLSYPTGAVEIQSAVLNDGKTNITLKAKQAGRAELVVATNEGNLVARTSIVVVSPLKKISFAGELLPIAKGEWFNLKNYLTFSPSGTNQTAVTYSLSTMPESEDSDEEFSQILFNDDSVFIPSAFTLKNFVLTATSSANSEIIASTVVEAVSSIVESDIIVYYDNGTPLLTTDDVVLAKVDGVYQLELARNTAEFNTKRLYFVFNGYANTDYVVTTPQSVVGIVQVDKLASLNNTFDVRGLGEGEVSLNFVVKNADYLNYSSLYKTVGLKVKVVSYPKQIELTNGTTDEKLSSITLFDTYSGVNRFGTPVKIVVKDSANEMFNQRAVITFSHSADRLKVRDNSGREIVSGDWVVSGTTVYISHNYLTGEVVSDDIVLTVSSFIYDAVKTEISVLFERGEIVLAVSNANLKLDLSNSSLQYPYGRVRVNFVGLPASFDMQTISANINNENLVGVEFFTNEIMLVGKGVAGATYVTFTAPNGSTVTVNVVLFEALQRTQTHLVVAGQVINEVQENATVQMLRNAGLVYSLKNSLSVDIAYVLNNKTFALVPASVNAVALGYDLSDNVITTTSYIVKVLAHNNFATQNRAGESLITITLRGYNQNGEQNEVMTFKFIINVEIPISSIQSNQSEVKVYDYNTLGYLQRNQIGEHLINLNVLPLEASFGYEEIKWTLIYSTLAPITVTPVIIDNEITYTFTLGNTTSTVQLTTHKLNYKQARVIVRLGGAQFTETFTIMASTEQNYFNAQGQLINSRRETRVKFNVEKAQKVDNIILSNVQRESVTQNPVITFDTRDLDWYNGQFNAPLAARSKVINFSVLPTSALTKDLAVKYSGNELDIAVNNAAQTITIVAKTKSVNGVPIIIRIYSLDSVSDLNAFGTYIELTVKILDGTNEQLAYNVGTAADLLKIGQNMSAYYKLTNNIYLDQGGAYSNWAPIGLKVVAGETQITEFTGSLNGAYVIDGNEFNYSINGLKIANGTTAFPYNHYGLFGVVGEYGVVKNITFNDISIEINDNGFNKQEFVFVGVVAGLNKGTVSHVLVEDGNGLGNAFVANINEINSGVNVSLDNYTHGIKVFSSVVYTRLIAVGGLVGVNRGTLTNNITSVLINTTDGANSTVYAGGLAGVNEGKNAVITKTLLAHHTTNSLNYDVFAVINIKHDLTLINSDTAFGGAVGFNMAEVSNLVVRAILHGNKNVGGLVGKNAGGQLGASLVNNNVALPTLSANENVGGLVGLSVDATYYLNATNPTQNLFSGIFRNSSSHLGSTLSNNKVEFLNYNYTLSLFNTAVRGSNYVGGLVGMVSSVVYEIYGVQTFQTHLSYNSVVSYVFNKPISNYYNENLVKQNGLFFGDIILENIATSNADINYAGGLFGWLENGLVVNHAFNASLVANNAIVAGFAGKVTAGVNTYAVVYAENISLTGDIVLQNTNAEISAGAANFFGDADQLVTPSNYFVTANDYANSKTLYVLNASYSLLANGENVALENLAVLGNDKVNFVSTYYLGQQLTLNLAWTNRSNSTGDIFHYASTSVVVTREMFTNGISIAGFEYLVVFNGTNYNLTFDFTWNSIFSGQAYLSNFNNLVYDSGTILFDDVVGYVVPSGARILAESYFNNDHNAEHGINYDDIIFERFSTGIYAFSTYVLGSDTVNDNGLTDAHDANVLQAITTYNETYYNVSGLTDEQLQNRITQIRLLINNASAQLQGSNWYIAQGLNGGLPVLLSARGFTTEIKVENNTLSYLQNVEFLRNWSPTSISFTFMPDHLTSHRAAAGKAVLYYTQISSEYFLPTGINFGDNSNYSAELINTLSSNVVAQIKQKNTYTLSDIFTIETLPAFVGKGAVTVTSSRPAVLEVVNFGGQINLVAKSVGRTTVTVVSNYNTELNSSIEVEIVQAVLENGFELQKMQNGNAVNLKSVDAFNVVKTNASHVNTVTLTALQTGKFNYSNSLIGEREFNLVKNLNSGVRYFLIKEKTISGVNYNSIYGNAVSGSAITINQQNFINAVQPNGEFASYVDVPFASTAVVTSSEFVNATFLAVPYVTLSDGEKVLLINETALGAEGVVGAVGETQLDATFGFAKLFTVKTINGTWGLSLNVQNINFEVMKTISFTSSIQTDNTNEVLFVSFVGADGLDYTISADAKGDSFNGNNYVYGNNTFKIGLITYYVTYHYNEATGHKIYNFEALVLENDRISENYETLSTDFTRTLKLFTVNNSDAVTIDDNGFVATYLHGDIAYSRNITITLKPQSVTHVSMQHYPSGEVKVVTDANGNSRIEMNLNEVAYDNIIPGYSGVLKVNVDPWYANLDYLTLSTSGAGTNVVTFEQLLARYSVNDKMNYFAGDYVGVYPLSEQSTNTIKLTRQSYTLGGNISFDGNFYVRTLINSYVGENNKFTLTLKGYATVEGVAGVQMFEKTLILNVVTPPGLRLSYNNEKLNPIAAGTNLVFSAEMIGVEGNIDFQNSYAVNKNGTIIYGLGTIFNITKLSDGQYRLSVPSNVSYVGYTIVVVGQVNKTINGQTYNYKDQITFQVSDFVITGVYVAGVVNGSYVGIFNQSYDLAVKINATYSPSLAGVLSKIAALEKEWSRVILASDNDVWFFKNADGSETLIKNEGYSANRTFVISIGGLKGYDETGMLGFRLQNIVYNSADVLGALIKFTYTKTGVVALNGANAGEISQSTSGLVYEFSTTFNFAFYRNDSEELPEPIRTAEEFAQMRAGINYILLSDITLNAWTPINTEIASLDGNGHVITLRSFNLPTFNGDSSTLIAQGNVGLFSVIGQTTTIKNVVVEIMPSTNISVAAETAGNPDSNDVDLRVSATAYTNLNFGLLAGINNGIITNSQVVYDASALKLERDLLLLGEGRDDPNFVHYWKINSSGGWYIDYNQFILNNFTKYFPRYNILSGNENNLWVDGKINSGAIAESGLLRRDLSVVKVNTTVISGGQTHYMGGLVGVNTGYITNSNVENITINGTSYVAGLVANNQNKISSSYFKGANVINRSNSANNSGSAGLVAFNSGTIQYSYVLGREGDGNNFVLGKYKNANGNEQELTTRQSSSDKTGLNSETKKNFAGHDYNTLANKNDYDYDYSVAALRAMNSIVFGTGAVGAFVYNNSGTILNSYANILINSATASAGFVYGNENSGVIRDVYSLSSVQNQSTSHSPFTGRLGEEGASTGTIEYAFYMKTDIKLNHINKQDVLEISDAFIDDKEVAQALYQQEMMDYNSYQGFAFNTDYTTNEEISRGVWFIPNGNELTNGQLKNFDVRLEELTVSGTKEFYVFNRPELVAANLKTLSVRKIISSETDEENKFEYVSFVTGQDITNPILISSAKEFNSYVSTQNRITNTQNDYIRMVRDIEFNNADIKAITYNVDYSGDFDGNGMNISQLRLVSDSDYEVDESKVIEKLGLFGGIYGTQNGDKINYAVVRNLNITIVEARGTNVNYVGVLAGIIKDARVYNITISGTEIVQGKHVVGGLAGYIGGDSEIVNITIKDVSAMASYYYNKNDFSLKNYRLSALQMGKANLFEIEVGTNDIANINIISYAGAVAGIINVSQLGAQASEDTLRNAKARRLQVSGNVYILADVVGGVIGGMSENSTANDLTFTVSGTPQLIASRLAGGIVGDLRGSIDRVMLKHEAQLQKVIDEHYLNSTTTQNNYIANYNGLFSSNAVFTGGLVGLNMGGKIYNAYNKVNVVNLSSQYAGGIVGLNIGGDINYVYTTATVSAFKIVGGIIGIALPINIAQDEHEKHEKVVEIRDALFTNLAVAKTHIPTETTIFKEVVAANVWSKEHVDVSAVQNKYPGIDKLIIGAFIGDLRGEEDESSGESSYDLKTAFDALTINEDVRKVGEHNYYHQVFLNGSFNSNNYTQNYTDLMPEIGAVNTNKNYKILNDVRKSGGNERPLQGITGNYIENQGGADEVVYHYSRLQNLGSARTHREIIARVHIPTEAALATQGTGAPAPTQDAFLPVIYNAWPLNYWKGSGVKRNGAVYEKVNAEFVYPEILPTADLSQVKVYNAEELALMNVYRRADFILMNDIDLLTYGNWQPAGTKSRPFTGRVYSDVNNTYTIKNLKISSTNNNFVGLVGYAKGASFNNFNLTVVGINITTLQSDEFGNFVGGLYGYGESVRVSNFAISGTNVNNLQIVAENVVAAGAIGGASVNSAFSNISITNFNTTINSLFKENVGVTGVHDGLAGVYVGGAFGYFDNNVPTELASGEIVQETQNGLVANNLKVNLLNGKTINKFASQEIMVGGLFGNLNTHEYSTMNEPNFNKIAVNADVKFASAGIVSQLSNVYVGGFAGFVGGVKIKNIEYVNNAEALMTVNLNTNYYKDTVYLGGFAGNYSGLNDSEGGQVNNLENLHFDNLKLGYNFENRTYAGQDIKKDVFIGGVFGKLMANHVQNLSANNVIVNASTTTTLAVSALNAYVAGFAGYVNSAKNASEIFVTNLALNIAPLPEKYLVAENNYVGGLIGYLQGASASNINKLAVSGTINTMSIAGSTFSVGGAVGAATNANISEVLSSASISHKISSGTNYIAGLIGTVNADTGSVSVSNSSSTGLVKLLSAENKANDRIAGLIGNVWATTNGEDFSFKLFNNYTISRIELFVPIVNETHVGALLGQLRLGNGRSAENVENVTMYSNYFNVEITPFINGYGTALNVDELLFSNNFKGFSGVSTADNFDNEGTANNAAWLEKEGNSYPLLAWISHSSSPQRLAALQSVGTHQNPEIYSGALANGKSYVVESAFSSASSMTSLYLFNLYFKQNVPVVSAAIAQNNGVLYGIKANAINANNGIISNAQIGNVNNNNAGATIINSTINSVTTNRGLLDMVNGPSGINVAVNIHATSAIISRSIFTATTKNGTIVNSYVDDYQITYYNSNGHVQYETSGTNINDYSTFDFNNAFVMFTGTSHSDYNYGSPALAHRYKTKWYSAEIDPEYVWGSGQNMLLGEQTANGDGTYSYTDLLLKIKTLSQNVGITTAQDLAEIAFATTTGETLSTYALGTGSGQTNSSVVDLVKTITTTTYAYGVKITTVKRVYNSELNPLTLTLANNINLSGDGAVAKLWTPIGSDENPFTGKIIGDGYYIENMSALGAENSGLFGVVNVQAMGSSALNEASFANNLIIKNSFAFNKGGSAGILAGKVYFATTGINYVVNGFGAQNVNVGGHIASGVIGQLFKNDGNNNENAALVKVYFVGDVKGDYASAITYYVNPDGNFSNNFYLEEAYFVSTKAGGVNALSHSAYGQSQNFIINDYKILGTVHNVYTLVDSEDVGYEIAKQANKITLEQLKGYNFNGFKWSTTNGWYRTHAENNTYPIFEISYEYWINETPVAPAGTGSIGDPYRITTPQHLIWVATRSTSYFASKYIILENNISLAGKLWSPIGKTSSQPFLAATFDGNNKTISGLITYGHYVVENGKVVVSSYENVGLFGYILGSTIKNLIVSNSGTSIISANQNAGVVGYAYSSTITNVKNYAHISATNRVGGIVGYAENSTITNNQNYGLVKSFGANVGGIVGVSNNSLISGNKNMPSAVVEGAENVGGIAGFAELNELKNNENAGFVNGNTRVGGIVGFADTISVIENYNNSTAIVKGIHSVGGIMGIVENSIIKGYTSDSGTPESDNEGSIFGQYDVGGIAGNVDETSSISSVRSSGRITVLNSSGDSNKQYAVGGIVGNLYGTLIEAELRFPDVRYQSGDTSLFYIKLSSSDNAATYIGGIVGLFNSNGSNYIANIFNGTSVEYGQLDEYGMGYPNSPRIVYKALQIYANNGNGTLIGHVNGALNSNSVRLAASKLTSVGLGSQNINLIGNSVNGSVYGVVLNYELGTSIETFNASFVWSVNSSRATLEYRLPYVITKPTGSGTLSNPYVITIPENLYYIKYMLESGYLNNNYTYLTQQNNISNVNLTRGQIGNATFPFRGSYEGNNYTVSIASGNSLGGIFGKILGTSSQKSIVRNLTIQVNGGNVGDSGKDNIGAFANSVEYVNITNISVNTYGVKGASNVGGLVGYSLNSDIKNSTLTINNSSLVDGYGNRVGGLIGLAEGGEISQNTITNNLTVESTGSFVGGLIGYSTATVVSSNIIKIDTISGNTNVGGLIGYSTDSDILSNEVLSAYRLSGSNHQYIGSVVASGNNAGGIVGNVSGGTLNLNKFSYSNINAGQTTAEDTTIIKSTSGNNVGGLAGGVSDNATVTNNTIGVTAFSGPTTGVPSLSIKANKSVGGLIGFANYNTYSGNKVNNTTVILNGVRKYSSVTFPHSFDVPNSSDDYIPSTDSWTKWLFGKGYSDVKRRLLGNPGNAYVSAGGINGIGAGTVFGHDVSGNFTTGTTVTNSKVSGFNYYAYEIETQVVGEFTVWRLNYTLYEYEYTHSTVAVGNNSYVPMVTGNRTFTKSNPGTVTNDFLENRTKSYNTFLESYFNKGPGMLGA